MSLSTRVVVLLLASATAAHAEDICVVQGTGDTSPFAGQHVSVSGVVTADFTTTSVGGFFIQDPVCDADSATSDAIFVRGSGLATMGHQVSVSGLVEERDGQTSLTLESLHDEGPFSGNLEVVALDPPADADAAHAYLEAREGMLAALPESVVVAATDDAGEAFVLPASAGIDRVFRGASEGRLLAIDAPGGWPSLAHGDRVTGAVGIVAALSGRFALWLPTDAQLDVSPAGTPLPEAPPADGQLSIGSYSLDRLYDATDDPGHDDVVLGADAYARALARRAYSIGTLLGSPDLLGVQEVESQSVLADLAATPELAAAGYQPLVLEGEDPTGLDVGLLYRPDRLRLVAAESRQACTSLDSGLGPCSTGGQGRSLFARPPLVARLEVAATGERLAAIVVDFRGPHGSVDPALRLAMADHVAALAASLRADGSAVLVCGDLDDTADSPTLARLTADGSLRQLQASGDYSEVAQGLSQQVDFVLVDAGLAPRAIGAPLHVNVDFPAPAPGSAEGHRASDHDPVLIRLHS